MSKDHFHILAFCPLTLAPSENMMQIKERTSDKLFEKYLTSESITGGQHFWARGYFYATVGRITEEIIQQYLEHQIEPNPTDESNMDPD